MPSVLPEITWCPLATKSSADDLVARGHQVISGNTDGITVLTKNLEDLRERYKHWEKVFEIAIDEEEFGSIVLKDINNYTAIGLDGRPIQWPCSY